MAIKAVTQAQLKEFLHLREEGKLLRTQRKDLLEQFENGACIEPGQITAYIDRQFHYNLTAKSLAPILGQKRVEELHSLVEPTLYRYLVINDVLDEC